MTHNKTQHHAIIHNNNMQQYTRLHNNTQYSTIHTTTVCNNTQYYTTKRNVPEQYTTHQKHNYTQQYTTPHSNKSEQARVVFTRLLRVLAGTRVCWLFLCDSDHPVVIQQRPLDLSPGCVRPSDWSTGKVTDECRVIT